VLNKFKKGTNKKKEMLGNKGGGKWFQIHSKVYTGKQFELVFSLLPTRT